MRHRRPRRGRHGLLLQRPQPLYVCCDNPVCRLFHRGGPARALFALRGVIRGTVAWQPCLVSAMDSSTIVRAAPGTVIPIVVAAAAVGAAAKVCATSEKQDSRGSEDHCVTSVSTASAVRSACRTSPRCPIINPRLFEDRFIQHV